jgi:hypothetical protein
LPESSRWQAFLLSAIVASCSSPGSLPDAGQVRSLDVRFPAGAWQVLVQQEGEVVGVYTWERNFDSGLAEVGRSTWSPSTGLGEKRVFGAHLAPFGGSFLPGTGSAVAVTGLAGGRALEDVRFVGRNGMILFAGGEIATTCSGQGDFSFVGHADEGTDAVWLNWRGVRCQPAARCRGFHSSVTWGSTVDGGVACLLDGFEFSDRVNPSVVPMVFHPSPDDSSGRV